MSLARRVLGDALWGLAAHLLLCWGACAYLLSRLAQGQLEAQGWLLLLAKPTLLAAAAAACALAWRGDRRPGVAAALAAAAAAIVALGAHGEGAWDQLRSMVPAVLSAAAAGWALRRGGRPRRAPAVLAAGLAGGALVHAARPPETLTRVNALGLVCEAVSRSVTRDYSASSNKDSYPVCVFRYNSLGYRDEEPPSAAGRRRVLLVGDSYVWGDGIPSNEETLGRLLAAELERAAPGRFEVMSAGYPGLGLYGYARIIEELQPRYRPAVVVVGWLGGDDEDPLDPQLIADRLPSAPWARNLVLALRAARQVSESSMAYSRYLWRSPANAAYFAGLQGTLARRAAQGGYRLVFLAYDGSPRAPLRPAELVALPRELRYPGHPSPLWYAKDSHPKPALNRRLAGLLAGRIAGGRA